MTGMQTDEDPPDTAFTPPDDLASDGVRAFLPNLSLPRRPGRAGVQRAAAAVVTGALVALAGFSGTAAAAAHPASVAARHVVVCDLYVSRAAMVANSELNIPPAQAAFCVKPGAA